VFQKEKLLGLDETIVGLTTGLTLPLFPFAQSARKQNSPTGFALPVEPTKVELYWRSKKKNKT
jgi:hypothetical protein